jgi:hypothetical protein
MEGHVSVRPGGSNGAQLDLANLSQVRDEAIAHGLLTTDEADRMATLLQSPEFAILSPVMFSAWGRRPLQPS